VSWLRRLSIRTRITIQTLAVALVLCSLAAALFRLNVESILTSASSQLLVNDAGPFEAVIRRTPVNPTISVGEGQLIAIVSPSGSVVRSTLPHRLVASIPVLERLHTKPREISAGKHTYLARRERVRTSAGTWAIISVRDEEQGDLVLDRLTLTLLIGDLVLVLGFGVVAWLLTGAALRPVNNMRIHAEHLSASSSLDALPVGPAHDELGRLAETLNAFIERNRQTVERERQMVSDASHELRTPIAILSGQLEVAASSDRHVAAIRREVNAARGTVARLARLANNLLELARIESGQHQGATAWGELRRELAASIDRARLLAQPERISVDFEISGIDDDARTYPLTAPGFASVVDNILTNAITAVPKRGTIRLTAVQTAASLVVRIVDDGPGMPAGFLPVAFDRFTRPDDSRQRAYGGTGLGLAIVRAIVVAAGGEVTLENRQPGLAVVVTVPRAN
jgi:two-component system OmpR family sensor kinase